MRKSPLALLTLFFFTAAWMGCGGGTSDGDKERIETLDSLEMDLNNSVRTLEEKTNELERSIDDLDTTTVYK